MTESERYKEVTDDLRLAYDRKAGDRDKKPEPPWKETERQDFLRLLKQEGKSFLLEIGAGPGWDSLFFQENDLKVISTDLSPEMVRLCRQKGLEAYEMDFLHLDFPPASFDAIYARNCLLHVPKEHFAEVLQAIWHLMAPGGFFFLGLYGGIEHEGAWAKDTYNPKRYFANYTNEQIQALTGANFSLRSFKTIALPETEETGLHFQRLILQKRRTKPGLD